MKGVNFVKRLPMTKKKVIRNFGENRRELFKSFCLKINFPKMFALPIFVTQIFAGIEPAITLKRLLWSLLGALVDATFRPEGRGFESRSSSHVGTIVAYVVGVWWRIGRVATFRPEGRGFESRSSRHVGTLGKSFTYSQRRP